MTESPIDRLEALESRHRRVVGVLIAQAAVLAALLAVLAAGCGDAWARGEHEPARIRVEEIVVVDSAGVERVRIGGNLPDAVIDGRRVPRGEAAAGVLIYDGTGQERGGYVTWEPSGNVGLTLDTRAGQVALFVAGPESSSALRLWHGDDAVELRSDGDGSRLTVVEDGGIVVQEPPVESLGADACAGYREARKRFSEAEVVDACRQRFPEAACAACLEDDR